MRPITWSLLSVPVRGTFDVWTFAELLIDCEEDRRSRAVLVGMLRERA